MSERQTLEYEPPSRPRAELPAAFVLTLIQVPWLLPAAWIALVLVCDSGGATPLHLLAASIMMCMPAIGAVAFGAALLVRASREPRARVLTTAVSVLLSGAWVALMAVEFVRLLSDPEGPLCP